MANQLTLPAASRATVVIEWLPFETPLLFHETE